MVSLIGEKIKNNRKLWAAFSAFFAAGLFAALCLLLHITPFGDKTFLYEDMKQQYVDFFSYYHNVWHGEDGFFYSENCGLGSDMFGIWAYYLTSPFLLMFIFIKDQYYAIAVTFLIMFKVAAMAATTSLFFSYIDGDEMKINKDRKPEYSAESKHEYLGGKNIIDAQDNAKRNSSAILAEDYFLNSGSGKLWINVLLSVVFSFSAWTVANMTNIMWLDAVILMPIVLTGFFKMMRGESKGRAIYIISVMVMIVLNYYISAMVLMFLGAFAVLQCLIGYSGNSEKLSIREVADRKNISGSYRNIDISGFAEFITTTVVALILDAWFLVPTVLSLMGSNKDHSADMVRAFSEYLPSSEAVGRNLSPFSVISKLFTMSYDSLEIMNGLPNIYFGAVLIIPCILFFFNRSIHKRAKLLCGSYLIMLMMFFCIKPLNTLAHGGTEAYGYLYRYSFIFSFVCLILVYYTLTRMEGIVFKDVLIACGIALGLFIVSIINKPGFMGTKAWIINAGLVAVSAAFMGWISRINTTDSLKGKSLNKTLKIAARAIFVGFVAVLVLDISMNFVRVYKSSSMNAETASGYMEKCILTRQALSKVMDIAESEDSNLERITVSDDGFFKSKESYRLEFLSPRTPNDSLHYDYNGTTTYNSLLKVENRLFMYKLGFNDNGLYTTYDAQNTACADAILGIKYLIGDDGKITENPYVLPVEYTSGENVTKLLEKIDETRNPFTAQEMLLKGFTGMDSKVFYEAEIEKEEQNLFKYVVTPSLDGELYFYMNREGMIQRALSIYLDGEFVSGYGNASCQKVIDLGYHHKGEKIELMIEDGDHMGTLPGEPEIVTEDVKVLESVER
ncbi:YfhO family protein [Butyrivibrio sp. WCE2006]|uniref:YfhO family protein n=1 Tax=Butyrivibrio sp. WCE2006 TaxID=1410611 RepID=UPI0005D1AB76|nr:YfhO family protein [Butyrivibrio sp. WCE2006]